MIAVFSNIDRATHFGVSTKLGFASNHDRLIQLCRGNIYSPGSDLSCTMIYFGNNSGSISLVLWRKNISFWKAKCHIKSSKFLEVSARVCIDNLPRTMAWHRRSFWAPKRSCNDGREGCPRSREGPTLSTWALLFKQTIMPFNTSLHNAVLFLHYSDQYLNVYDGITAPKLPGTFISSYFHKGGHDMNILYEERSHIEL